MPNVIPTICSKINFDIFFKICTAPPLPAAFEALMILNPTAAKERVKKTTITMLKYQVGRTTKSRSALPVPMVMPVHGCVGYSKPIVITNGIMTTTPKAIKMLYKQSTFLERIPRMIFSHTIAVTQVVDVEKGASAHCSMKLPKSSVVLAL